MFGSSMIATARRARTSPLLMKNRAFPVVGSSAFAGKRAATSWHPGFDQLCREQRNHFPVDKLTLHSVPSQSSVNDEAARYERVRSRTRELAAIAGRAPWDVSQRDYEQAKQELRGNVADDPVATDGFAP